MYYHPASRKHSIIILNKESDKDDEEASKAGQNDRHRVKKTRAPLYEEEEELRHLILERDEFDKEREEDQLD